MHPSWNPKSRHYPVINADRQKAIFQAVSHLSNLGHSRISYIAELSPTNATQQEKLKGFLGGVAHCRLSSHPDMTIDSGGRSPDAGYAAAVRLLDSSYKPTAVISGSYDLTAGMIRALQERGVSIPRDLSVISYDNIPQMNNFAVPITAVGASLEMMAETIVKMMLDLINKSNLFSSHFEVDTELVERASVRAL